MEEAKVSSSEDKTEISTTKTSRKKEDLLEMKWMSVVRLKKQVMEL
jgi:hypothetical protein